MEDDAAQKRLCFLDPEHILEAFAEVSIEVVHDQMDAPRLGIDLFEQVPDEGHEIGFGTMFGDYDGAASTPTV